MYQQVILLGNLGRDPEISYTQGGMAIAKFSLATSRQKKVKDGWENETAWHNIVVFGKTAENITKFLRKGSKCQIIGYINYSNYTNKEGVTVYRTEIVAEKVTFLDKLSDKRESENSESAFD